MNKGRICRPLGVVIVALALVTIPIAAALGADKDLQRGERLDRSLKTQNPSIKKRRDHEICTQPRCVNGKLWVCLNGKTTRTDRLCP